MINIYQPTFSGGEFSPRLAKRGDLARYGTGLKTAKNVLVHPTGGIYNRNGTQYISSTKINNKKTILKRFQYSQGDTFILEFGHLYVRMYSTIYNLLKEEIVTPYTENDLDRINVTQSRDVLFVTHPDYPIKEITRYTDTLWTISDYKPQFGAFYQNPYDGSKLSINNIAFVNGNTTFDLISNDGFFRQGTLPPSESTSGKDDNFIGDQFYLKYEVSEQFSKKTLTSSSSSSATYVIPPANIPNVATISTSSINGTLYIDTYRNSSTGAFDPANNIFIGTILAFTGTGSGTYTYSLNCNVGQYFIFVLRFVGNGVTTLNINYASGLPPATSTLSQGAETDIIIGKGVWRLTTSGNWSGRIYIEKSYNNIDWTVIQSFTELPSTSVNVTGLENEIVYLRARFQPTHGDVNVQLSFDTYTQTIIGEITGLTDKYKANCKLLNGIIKLKETDTSRPFTENFGISSWSKRNGYPIVSMFYQDRLVFASTYADPSGIWMSETGNYYNFIASDNLVDSDPISININSRENNTIKSIAELGGIIAISENSSWLIGASDGEVVTPTNVKVASIGRNGANNAQPIVVNNSLMYANTYGNAVRELTFDIQTRFNDVDLTLFSEHLFKNASVTKLCYQAGNKNIVWALLDNGMLLSLTYIKSEEILAWTWHVTAGFFESIETVYGDGQDELYCIVRRGNNRYLEKIANDSSSGNMARSNVYQFIVDCGIVIENNSPTNEITGLTWLANKTVSILADGDVHPPREVNEQGELTLDYDAEVVIVGLPYESVIETLSPVVQLQNGVSIGKKIKVPSITFFFLDSRGLLAGKDRNSASPVYFRTEQEFQSTIQQTSQTFKLIIPSSFDYDGSVYIIQKDPLAFNIIAIMKEIQVS